MTMKNNTKKSKFLAQLLLPTWQTRRRWEIQK